MVAHSKHHTIRIERALHERLLAVAADRACSSSQVIRDALEAYFRRHAAEETSARRSARTGEFTQLVLDLILRNQFPDVRDRLIAETDRLMELYHGA